MSKKITSCALQQMAVHHLGLEVSGMFEFDADGECELLYQNELPVMIRLEENGDITLAVSVAFYININERELLADIMSYQLMGQKTDGYLLSWNNKGETIILSHRVYKEHQQNLGTHLSKLIEKSKQVKHDIHDMKTKRNSFTHEFMNQFIKDKEASQNNSNRFILENSSIRA